MREDAHKKRQNFMSAPLSMLAASPMQQFKCKLVKILNLVFPVALATFQKFTSYQSTHLEQFHLCRKLLTGSV